ncbi:MAG: hypothetical protein J7599_00175 [Niabella sp.]|nr:hypothetical protein [Niabella sp.]
MKNNDPFDMARWSREGITEPIKGFSEIFSYMDIEGFRRVVKKIADHALTDKIYRQSAPGDVLMDMKVVRSALIAAHALKDTTGKGFEATKQDLLYPWQYCTGMGKLNHWGDFPRNVSFKEYCHPYQVFKKLFKRRQLNEWLTDWEKLVEVALSPSNLDGELTVLHARTGLLKLLEAAHLVWIRDGDGGFVKEQAAKQPNGQNKTVPAS